MQLAILGRQPKLSLAELEVLFGADKISKVGSYAALINVAEVLPQARLGGTLKCARVLTRLETTDLTGAFTYLANTIPDHLLSLPEGKLQFGVSIYGAKAQRNWLLKQMLTLKKIIKKNGRSVRIIENKAEALESAQVLYNKLTGPLGWELLLVVDGNDLIVAQTTGIQNIDDYAKRDFGRPKRDAFVGMLPPKLAQIMINLAVASTPPSETVTVLDPFCGTGVVLQETLLMGYAAAGSDIEQRMIDYTNVNIFDWLKTELPDIPNAMVELGDATAHTWSPSPDFVACETYLGQPLTTVPNDSSLQKIMTEANNIAEGFLSNIAKQLQSGTRLCVALPAWAVSGRFLHLKVLDRLTDLGYNRIDLKHATNQDLIYHREDQIVARELTILEKK